MSMNMGESPEGMPPATDAPTLPAWATQPTTSGGISELGAGPTIAPEKPIRSRKTRNIITAVTAAVLVALLGGGVYWAYAAFISRSDSQLAQYFPSNTVAFASMDLSAASNNKFKINPENLLGSDTKAFQDATGLDLQKDVMPWVGPDVAVGVFPLANAKGSALTNLSSAVGVTVLIQSHDDNAAKAAVAKLNAHMQQKGVSAKQSSYKNFTLYAPGASDTDGLYGTGSGWMIISSNADAAHAVIDRLNGSGETLATQQPFKDATSNLPSGHFGTYYVNLQQTLSSILPATAPNGLASISVPFIESYPVAGGYLGWTDNGERSQITFNAVRNPNIPNVSGDTTGFASLVPADAAAYAGVGNLGKLAQSFISQFGTLGTGADPLKSALGISMNDPLAQQPAGVAAIKSGTKVNPVFFVHVADTASATQLLNEVAAAHNWKATPTTVAGQTATALNATVPTDQAVPPIKATPSPTTPSPVTTTVTTVAVAVTLNNTLVIAPDAQTVAQIVQVAHGNVANLTSNANYQKMMKAAPSGAAATAYLDASALKPIAGVGSAATSGLFSQFDSLAFTLVWNDSMLQGTLDTGLHA